MFYSLIDLSCKESMKSTLPFIFRGFLAENYSNTLNLHRDLGYFLQIILHNCQCSISPVLYDTSSIVHKTYLVVVFYKLSNDVSEYCKVKLISIKCTIHFTYKCMDDSSLRYLRAILNRLSALNTGNLQFIIG